MTERFFKKVKTIDAVETLCFYSFDKPESPLISYDLSTLRMLREEQGDMIVAKSIHTVLSVILGSPLTSEEIEYAVEDI